MLSVVAVLFLYGNCLHLAGWLINERLPWLFSKSILSKYYKERVLQSVYAHRTLQVAGDLCHTSVTCLKKHSPFKRFLSTAYWLPKYTYKADLLLASTSIVDCWKGAPRYAGLHRHNWNCSTTKRTNNLRASSLTASGSSSKLENRKDH